MEFIDDLYFSDLLFEKNEAYENAGLTLIDVKKKGYFNNVTFNSNKAIK